MRLFLRLLLSVACVAIPAASQDDAELMRKVAARAARELPVLGKIFHQNPQNPVSATQTRASLSFFYGQSEAKEVVTFPKVIASIGYRGNQEYTKEQIKGEAPFTYAATELHVSIYAPGPAVL